MGFAGMMANPDRGASSRDVHEQARFTKPSSYDDSTSSACDACASTSSGGVSSLGYP